MTATTFQTLATATRRRARERDWSVPVGVTVAIVALVILAGIPLARVLVAAFSSDGREVIGSMATSPVNRRVGLNTLRLGFVVGVVGTLVGFLFAYVQARLDVPGKRALHLIALLPIVSPPFAVATSVITLFGRNGVISYGIFGTPYDIYGLDGLTLVLALSFFPVAYMNLLGMLRALDPSLDEASSLLGASGWKTFLRVTLPMLAPGLASSFLLLFVESIADLGNPVVLGGDYTVLASRAYIAVTGEYDVASGAAYSLVLLVPALAVFVVQRYWAGRRSVVSVSGKPTGAVKLSRARSRWLMYALAVACAVLIVVIYATVVLGGFLRVPGVNNRLTFEHFRFVLFGLGSEAMIDTSVLAVIATPIAGMLGVLIAWLVARKLKRGKGVLDFMGMIGIAVPGTVLGIGYVVAFNTPVSIGGLQLLPALAGGSALFAGSAAIVMVYVIRSMPASLRAGVGSLQQIHKALDEASISLGASEATTFRKITLPLIRPALVSGLTFALARSMTTLSPIVFLTTPGTKIMTKQMLSEVDGGRFGNALAYCTILMVIVLSIIALLHLNLWGRRGKRKSTSANTPVTDLVLHAPPGGS